MKKKLPIILLLIATTSMAQVQVNGYLNFSTAFPKNEYNEVNSKTGYGGRLGILLAPNKTIPLKLGIELGYMSRGKDRQYFSSNNWSNFSDYRVNAGINIFSFLFDVRIQNNNSKKGIINPFLDLQYGWNNFYATTSVEGKDFWSLDWERIRQESTKGHWAAAYGAGGGLDICLDKKYRLAWLELKVNYLKGNKSNYYTNPTVDGAGNVTYTQASSETDMLMAQVGIKFGW
jgi:hypothetical protein